MWSRRVSTAVGVSAAQALPFFETFVLAILCGLVFVKISHTPQESATDLLRQHEDLLGIERRGQLTVHLFGPLTKLFATSSTDPLASYASPRIVWTLVGTLCASSLRNVSRTNGILTALLLSTIIYTYTNTEVQDYALIKGSCSSDTYVAFTN